MTCRSKVEVSLQYLRSELSYEWAGASLWWVGPQIHSESNIGSGHRIMKLN